MQRQRVERKEITSGTLRNYQKTTKSFCETTDVLIQWKKVTKGLPRGKRLSDDRAPTLEEIHKITEYPDRRIKPIVYVMASSGIRVGAWDYLKWGHITPIMSNLDKETDSVIVAAKMRVYADEYDEYFTFISLEAYHALKAWMDFRQSNGEEITNQSGVMRNLWNTERSERIDSKNRSGIANSFKLRSIGIKRLMERALWTQNLRVKSDPKRKRYKFQTDHGFRKFFKTRCEIGGMKPINIEKLMGHSVGISDSYYRATEGELLEDYLKVKDFLFISKENRLQKQLKEYTEKNSEETYIIKGKLQEKDEEINDLKEQFSSMKNMLENLVQGLADTNNQGQVDTISKTLFSSGIINGIKT